MVSFKPVVKGLAFLISGIAIVVVGAFMMGAVARLWLPKKPNANEESLSKDDLDKKDKLT